MKPCLVTVVFVSLFCAGVFATISIDNNDPDANSNGGDHGWGDNNSNNNEEDSSSGISETISKIVKIPHTILGFIKESGLYILVLPLLIIIPICIFLTSFKNFIQGLFDNHGWRRSLSDSHSLLGARSRVKLDDKVVKRILKSV